ncbi:hypothetical protein [Bacillus sp. SJS]|nr:hypothetical protein [Bacillus sp. SJS]
MKKDQEKSKISSDDGWNRTVYGSPTIGGVIVIIIVISYFLYQWIAN